MLTMFTRNRNCPRLAVLFAATGMILFHTSSGFAQKRSAEPEKRTGKLVEITKKGRVITLVVNVGGEEQKYAVNSRVDFGIAATGDDGFIREGSYVATEGIVTSGQFFANNFTVYPDEDGRPKPLSAKAPPAPDVVRIPGWPPVKCLLAPNTSNTKNMIWLN